MHIACRSAFQSIHRAAISRSVSTEKPIAHTSGSALLQFQLPTADMGMPSGITNADRASGSSPIGWDAVSNGSSTSTGSALPGNSTTPSARLAIAGRVAPTTTGSRGIPAHSGSTRHRGNSADKTGTTSSATIASSQTRCRVAAESRLRQMAAMAATTRSATPLTAESAKSRLDALVTPASMSIVRFILVALQLCLFDQRDQPLALVGRHLLFPRLQIRGERIFKRAAKKSLQHTLERVAAGLGFGQARNIDHLPTAFPPPEMSLFLQDVHHSPHRHGCRRGRNGFDDFVDG